MSVGVRIRGEGGQFPDSGPAVWKAQVPASSEAPGTGLLHEPSPKDSGCGRGKSPSSHFPVTDKTAFTDVVLGLSVEYAQWNFRF